MTLSTPIIPEIGEAEGLRVAILARSGHGKSFLARYIIERIIDAYKMPVVIIEPVTEYESLLEAYEGVVFKNEGGVPLEPETMVEVSLTVPLVIINYEDVTLREARVVLSDYLERLVNKAKKQRKPFLLVIEEAHLLAPQRYTKESLRALEKIEYIAKIGRKLGANYLLVSQRPANISKDVLSQVNILFAGKFSHPRDTRAVEDIAVSLGVTLTVEDLAGLGKGEFVEILNGEKIIVKAPKPKTRHLGGTPFNIEPVKASRINYGELLEKAKARLAERREYVTVRKEEYDKLRSMLDELSKEKKELENELEKCRVKLETIQIVASKLSGVTIQEGQRGRVRDQVVKSLPRLEARILEVLTGEPTGRMPLYELARKAGTKRRSQRFIRALRRLRELGLIEYDLKRGYARAIEGEEL